MTNTSRILIRGSVAFRPELLSSSALLVDIDIPGSRYVVGAGARRSDR